MRQGSKQGRGWRGTVAVAVVAAAGGALGVGLATAGSGPNGTVGELRYVESHWASTSSGGWNHYRATCPKARHVTGGGYDVGGADVTVHDAGPFDSDDADSIEDDGYEATASTVNGGSSITVTAICDK